MGSDGKMATHKKTTIDGKEVEIPKYFEIEDDKFGKIVFGEESFQGDMMTAEKQILEGTASTPRGVFVFTIPPLAKPPP